VVGKVAHQYLAEIPTKSVSKYTLNALNVLFTNTYLTQIPNNAKHINLGIKNINLTERQLANPYDITHNRNCKITSIFPIGKPGRREPH